MQYQVETKYLSKNSGNVIGIWGLILPPATRRSLGEHEMGRPEEQGDIESVPPRLDLLLNSHTLFLKDALSTGMPLQREGNWLPISLALGQRSKGHPVAGTQPPYLTLDIRAFQNLRLWEGHSQGIWSDVCKMANELY